jgi:hypothetical protein
MKRRRGFPGRRRGEPIVIRMVTEWDRKDRPKVARDRKAMLVLERVSARADRPCARGIECQISGLIAAGTEYAKATDLDPRHADGPFIRGRRLNKTADFHFECVWPEARPLVRFLRNTPPEEGAS